MCHLELPNFECPCAWLHLATASLDSALSCPADRRICHRTVTYLSLRRSESAGAFYLSLSAWVSSLVRLGVGWAVFTSGKTSDSITCVASRQTCPTKDDLLKFCFPALPSLFLHQQWLFDRCRLPSFGNMILLKGYRGSGSGMSNYDPGIKDVASVATKQCYHSLPQDAWVCQRLHSQTLSCS